MPPLQRKLYRRIAIDFVHDLSAGVFPGVALAAWVIRSASETSGEGAVAVSRTSSSLVLLMVAAVVALVVTGLLRLKYWKLNVRSGFLEAKGQMAAIKHSLFVLTALGSAVLLAMAVS